MCDAHHDTSVIIGGRQLLNLYVADAKHPLGQE